MDRVIALTGATGFIGSSLARRLVGQGWRVRALVRPSSRTAHLRGLGVDLVEGGLDELPALERLVSGAQAVVYCAGSVRGLERRDFEPVNVAGVGHVSRVAGTLAEPPRILLISSLAARCPGLSAYAWSKREGERMLAHRAASMAWTVLRPPAVYGPGDRELMPLFHWMRRGLAPVLGDPQGRVSLVFIDDLVEVIARWAEVPVMEPRVLEVHDGKVGGYSWDEVIRVAERLRGRRIVRLAVPRPLAHLAAFASSGVARARGRAPMFTPDKLRELLHPDWVCDNREICSMIGWRPRVDLYQGLARTLQWRR